VSAITNTRRAATYNKTLTTARPAELCPFDTLRA
jgi:hypothetical protein